MANSNLVNFDCRPGDVIIADWRVGRSTAVVTTTYPNGILMEIDGQEYSATYQQLRERGAEYVSQTIPIKLYDATFNGRTVKVTIPEE